MPEPVNSFDANDCYNFDPFNPYNPNISSIQNVSEVIAPLKKSNFGAFSYTKLPISVPLFETKQFLTGKKRQRRRSISGKPPCKSIVEESNKIITNSIISPKPLLSQIPTSPFLQPITVPTLIVASPILPISK